MNEKEIINRCPSKKLKAYISFNLNSKNKPALFFRQLIDYSLEIDDSNYIINNFSKEEIFFILKNSDFKITKDKYSLLMDVIYSGIKLHPEQSLYIVENSDLTIKANNISATTLYFYYINDCLFGEKADYIFKQSLTLFSEDELLNSCYQMQYNDSQIAYVKEERNRQIAYNNKEELKEIKKSSNNKKINI